MYNDKSTQIVIIEYDLNDRQSKCVVTVPYFQSFHEIPQ